MSLYLGTTPIANTGYDKADTSLSNLTSTGKNIANWSNNVTNCITEIPQDIQLELNNGALILKAGSKVYVPNGFEADGVTPKFDEVIVTSDLTCIISAQNKQVFICVLESGLAVNMRGVDESVSGSGVTTTGGFAYDISENKLYYYNSSGVQTYRYSLPIAICTVDLSQITSINQVFNGFCYIGSTVFALPGVKGLIPNGRNEDGTLKNTNMLLNKVCMLTLSGGWSSNNQQFTITEDGDIGTNVFTYNEYENYVMYQDEKQKGLIFAQGKITNTKIDNIYFKTVFHTLDYNDSPTISGWSMPSSRYIGLTLGASGATYIAPANGWFNCHVRLASSGQGVALQNTTTGVITRVHAISANQLVATFIPARKGDTIIYQYGTEATTSPTNTLHFYYAEGEN